METHTFDDLPGAVDRIHKRLDSIERLLAEQDQKATASDDDLLTVQDAAKFLSLTVPTVYSKVSRGELPVMKRTKRLYFSREDLVEYIRAGRRKTNAEIQNEAHTYLKRKGADNG